MIEIYNSKSFEEQAFNIYIQGMKDFESLLERKLMGKCDDYECIQEIVDEAQREFEENAH